MDEAVKRVNAVFFRGGICPGYLRLNFLETFLTQAADLCMSWFAVERRLMRGESLRLRINRLGWPNAIAQDVVF
ncbi:MAG: hypothetical protein FWF95_08405 [Syntrophorhabdaceae bacterium]|nr:hypothetical protein [Syntrophorhabdaceae bacterium]